MEWGLYVGFFIFTWLYVYAKLLEGLVLGPLHFSNLAYILKPVCAISYEVHIICPHFL
jgi:hypothetical protein